ncbi:hypothetical protein [Nostoc sp. PCC 7524]|nr:hypothetical protein [Nostoc sp. PCC 7524]
MENVTNPFGLGNRQQATVTLPTARYRDRPKPVFSLFPIPF